MKKKYWILIVIGAILLCGILGIIAVRQPVKADEGAKLAITPKDNYRTVMRHLDSLNVKFNKPAFELMARLRHYPQYVKSGMYNIESGMSTYALFRKLYIGADDPVKVVLGKYRTLDKLCEYVSSQLYMSSEEMMAVLQDSSVVGKYGYNTQTVMCLFIPNTYEFYWDVTPKNFVKRMAKESENFWNGDRMAKAEALNMSPIEVIILASIVEEETNKADEKPLVASVYLNRLRKGMLLQADPTVKYAVGDFTLKRILYKHLEVDSPYNTYRYVGLPPAPICTPSISSIDAVLENRQTDYLFFCARPQFDGYHNFSTTLSQHNANASKYHKAVRK